MRSIGQPYDEDRRAAVRQALGALTGVVPVGVVAVDLDGRPWYQSQRWQDVCGAAGDTSDDQPWYVAVHPADRETVASRWGGLVDRRGQLGEFRVVGNDGGVRQCRAETVAMVGAHGGLDGYLVLVSDGDADADAPSQGDAMPTLSTPYLLSAVLEHSHDVITILNPDGSWRWSNGSAIRLVGHQEDFDSHDGLFKLLHPDDVPAARAALARALAGELPPDELLELRMRAADGTWRVMEGLVDSLLDEPTVRGFVVHLRDVTDRHRARQELEAALRRMTSFMGSMRTAAVLEDEDRRVLFINQSFLDMHHVQMRPADVVGRTLRSLGITADRYVVEPADAAALGERLRAGGRRIDGLRYLLVDGRTLERDFVPVIVHGVNRGQLSVFRDVTDQVRIEAERERLLASEREENRRLAELDAHRSEAIAVVSHELRTPLTSIVGYTELLRSLLDKASSTDELACLDAIVRNVDRLLRLAGDLVALDSLESEVLPLPVASVDVAATVRRAVRTIAPQAADTSIEVTVDAAPGPDLLGDGDRLEQLFENLLSNAVKFTPAGGTVSVTAKPEDGGWQVVVTDSGIGIPEDELTMLFTRFFRASNARRRGLPGSGLGLSVARAIAERHGGGLSVRSEISVGTSVTVWVGDAVDAVRSEA